MNRPSSSERGQPVGSADDKPVFSGSIVAIATPMNERGELDLEAYDRLLDMHLAAGTSGVVVAGTTGEGATLDQAEVCTLVERTADRVEDRMSVIAGCGSNSTARTMGMARSVVDAGAEATLVVTPYYNRPPQRGMREHFLRVADASSKPMILYNVPSRTACDLQPETVAELAAHPLIVAIKEATGSLRRGEQIVAQCGDDLVLLSGDDQTFVDLMAVGARGVISVTANVAPDTMSQICTHALAGEYEPALKLNNNLAALHAALLVEANPIPLKWALTKMGLITETLRLPLVPLDDSQFGLLCDAMDRAGVPRPDTVPA